mgnify:FL=1
MTINDIETGVQLKLGGVDGVVDWVGSDKFRFKYADPNSGYFVKDYYLFTDLDKFTKVVQIK